MRGERRHRGPRLDGRRAEVRHEHHVLDSKSSGWTSGSRSKTSSPAPAISPSRSAAASAASSTIGPRAVLTRYAELFIAVNCSAPIR